MKHLFSVLVLLIAGSSCASLIAQPVMTPRNMALGGGGSTYITDYNAVFINPANLMINDRSGDTDIGFLSGSFYIDAVLNHTGLQDQYHNFLDYVKKYDTNGYTFRPEDRTKLLRRDFRKNRSLSSNQTRYDLNILGVKWKRSDAAFALTFRSRSSTRYFTGKGWYTQEKVIRDNREIMDRSLISRSQTIHEVSFGYAESVEFLSGLTPRLDNFFIGIAPKLVLGGGYQNAEWINRYERQLNSPDVYRTESFNYAATGNYARAALDYTGGTGANESVNQHFGFEPASLYGMGAGLDVGMTYLYTFGSDLSAVGMGDQTTRKSLRLSFSITDIGFIAYSNDNVSIRRNPDSVLVNEAPRRVAGEPFLGTQGQYIAFTDRYSSSGPFRDAVTSEATFSTLLPLALHGGALLELNRLKLMGDLSIGLTNNAFNSTTLRSSAGIEIKPLLFLPLRAGVQFEGSSIRFLSAGAAIETKSFDISVAAQFSPESTPAYLAVSGVSTATFRFHF